MTVFLSASICSVMIHAKVEPIRYGLLAVTSSLLGPSSHLHQVTDGSLATQVLSSQYGLVDIVSYDASEIWIQQDSKLRWQVVLTKQEKGHGLFQFFHEVWMVGCSGTQLFGRELQSWSNMMDVS